MELYLSDMVTCPRCGPEHGLVVMPYEVEGRRVVEGVIGCPNCRERYPVSGGAADFAGGNRASSESASMPEPGASSSAAGGTVWEVGGGAVGVGGLLGLAGVRGPVVLGGPARRHAPALSELVEGLSVVAVAVAAAAGRASLARAEGVSLFEVADAIPLRTGSMAGVALTGPAVALREEGVRVLRPGARLLLDPAPAEASAALASRGLEVLAEEGTALVAVRR